MTKIPFGHKTEASERLEQLLSAGGMNIHTGIVRTAYRVVVDELTFEQAQHIASRYRTGYVESYTEVDYGDTEPEESAGSPATNPLAPYTRDGTLYEGLDAD